MKPKFDHKVRRPNGPWVPSGATDVKKTFDRIRKQQKPSNVQPLRKAWKTILAGCGMNKTHC